MPAHRPRGCIVLPIAIRLIPRRDEQGSHALTHLHPHDGGRRRQSFRRSGSPQLQLSGDKGTVSPCTRAAESPQSETLEVLERR
jgi:hypothetical protein